MATAEGAQKALADSKQVMILVPTTTPGFKTVQDFKDFDRFVVEGHYKTKTLLEFLGKK